MSLNEESEKCGKIHDALAEYWNWAYYNTPHSKCSWILGEYVKRLKFDVENRIPIMLQELEELLEQHSKNTFSVLDVGCGVGGFIQRAIIPLSEKYSNVKFRISGVDISSEMINYAKKNLANFDVELVCDSITNPSLKFKNEPFDVAIIMATLSFYKDENAKEILHAIHSKLTSGGWLAILDFVKSYQWADFTFLKKPLQKLTDMFFSHLIGESVHFNTRTKNQLEALLNDTSFKITKSELSDKKSKLKGMAIIRAQALKSKVKDKSEEPFTLKGSKSQLKRQHMITIETTAS
jgi:SAM-dependent methyltransferase